MANEKASTALLEARAFLKDSNNKKFEMRKEKTNILSGFMQDREFTIPALQAIRKAEKQLTKVEYATRKAFTIGTEKSCAPSGETAGSGISTVAWSQKNFTIQIREKMYQNNDINRAQGIANDLWEGEKSLFLGANGVDAALLAYLEANKTQVNALSAGGGHNSWNAALNQVEVANADINRYYDYMQPEMEMNNYDGTILDFTNTIWRSEWNHYVNQGSGNNVNTAYQFNDIDLKLSKLIVPTGYNKHVHYHVPVGGVAFLDWNDPLNLAGRVAGEKEWGTYESIMFPGLMFDTLTTYGCADTTSDGGAKQDLVTNIEFTLNYAPVTQPFSVANESAIFKYVNLNA